MKSSDLIAEIDSELLLTCANQELRREYPDYTPAVDMDRACLHLWRTDPFYIYRKDVRTVGDFGVAIRVASRHLETLSRKAAEQDSAHYQIEAITIVCDYEPEPPPFFILRCRCVIWKPKQP